MHIAQSLVLGLQVGEVGLRVRRAASVRPVRGAQDELPSAVRPHQHPQGLQPAVGVRLHGDLEGEALMPSRAASATPP